MQNAKCIFSAARRNCRAEFDLTAEMVVSQKCAPCCDVAATSEEELSSKERLELLQIEIKLYIK